MPDLKLAEPVKIEPGTYKKAPALSADTPRRWHTVIIQAPANTVFDRHIDTDGVLRINLYAPGEVVGEERQIQELTIWNEHGVGEE